VALGPGYRFEDHPAEVGYAHWPVLDEYLSELLTRPPEESTATPLPRGGYSWSSVDDGLMAIALAGRGARNQILNSAGCSTYLRACVHGTWGEEELKLALLESCQTCGLVQDYGLTRIETRLDGIIAWGRRQRTLGGGGA
jgi:hypothetical protein